MAHGILDLVHATPIPHIVVLQARSSACPQLAELVKLWIYWYSIVNHPVYRQQVLGLHDMLHGIQRQLHDRPLDHLSEGFSQSASFSPHCDNYNAFSRLTEFCLVSLLASQAPAQ